MAVLKFAVLAFGIWFVYGHLKDALITGKASLRGASYTLFEPWRFSLALGFNLAFGCLLTLSVAAPSAVASIVPSVLAFRIGELAWFAALLILFVLFAISVRLILFIIRR